MRDIGEVRFGRPRLLTTNGPDTDEDSRGRNPRHVVAASSESLLSSDASIPACDQTFLNLGVSSRGDGDHTLQDI